MKKRVPVDVAAAKPQFSEAVRKAFAAPEPTPSPRPWKATLMDIPKTEEQWRVALSPEQFEVLRKHGTERAWTSPLNEEHREGIFSCAGCGQPLFKSDSKFDSGTGWPSFFVPIENALETTTDRKYGMVRTEVHCSRCKSHLGHVFEDGPAPTGLRYCMNGVSLAFQPATQLKK
jgi:peptide-methionine (R)-S-oxide reductase